MYINKHLAQNVAIPDNGYIHDMLLDIAMFESITMLKCKGNNTSVVKLDDDDTMLQIKGYGYMDYTIMVKGGRHIGYYILNLGKHSFLHANTLRIKVVIFTPKTTNVYSYSQHQFPLQLLSDSCPSPLEGQRKGDGSRWARVEEGERWWAE